jgi:hypothetical protein
MRSIEYEVVQNPSLGAMAHWQFVKAWGDTADEHPILPWILLVLPLVYHARSSDAFAGTNQASGISMALQKEPEIPVGLQERVEGMADISLAALQLAVSTRLLERIPGNPWPSFVAVEKSLPTERQPQDKGNRVPLRAAKRLGAWFSQMTLAHACTLLNVSF